MTPLELVLVSVAAGASALANVWLSIALFKVKRELSRVTGELSALHKVLGLRVAAAGAPA